MTDPHRPATPPGPDERDLPEERERAIVQDVARTPGFGTEQERF